VNQLQEIGAPFHEVGGLFHTRLQILEVESHRLGLVGEAQLPEDLGTDMGVLVEEVLDQPVGCKVDSVSHGLLLVPLWQPQMQTHMRLEFHRILP
jgi:hypothetical protein